MPPKTSIRRISTLGKFAVCRVIYAVSETWKEITVLAIEKRLPYDDEDLERLLADLLG